MKIQNLSNSPKVPFDLDANILHTDEKVELVHLLLNPGETLTKHKNPFDVIFFVIEGSGILIVENETLKLKSNDTIKITSDKNRAWENKSNHILRLLVIKLIK